MKHLFSDLPAFQRDPLRFLLSKGESANASLIKLHIGLRSIYLLADPALVKPLLKADEGELDKGRLIFKFRQVIGNSMVTLSGGEYKRRRKVYHDHITRGIAQNYIPEISAIIREHAALYAKEMIFDAHKAMEPVILRVLCAIAFGRDALTRGDENALLEAVWLVEQDIADSFFKILPDWPWVKHQKKQRLKTSLMIMMHIVDRVRKGAAGSGLLHQLSALGLTNKEIKDEILMLFLGGQQTTGSAAAWMLYHMALEPDLAEQIAQEAATITDSSGEIDPAKLQHASISKSFVKEVLRLYPSFHWFSRETKKEMNIGGIRLQRGTSIIFSPWLFHRSEKFWKTPTAFSIDRNYNQPAYIPFGTGPRICLGMGIAMLELQLICLEIASAFNVEILSGVPAPAPNVSVTLIPPQIRIRLKLRSGPFLSIHSSKEKQAEWV